MYGCVMKNIYELQADLCKIFSNARRLEILELLKKKERSSSDLMAETGLSRVSLFQHLNVLKGKGVIATRREGGVLYYHIADLKIIQACNLMREVLLEQLDEKGKMVSVLKKK